MCFKPLAIFKILGRCYRGHKKWFHTYYATLCVFSEFFLLDVAQGVIVLVILENNPRPSRLQIQDPQ